MISGRLLDEWLFYLRLPFASPCYPDLLEYRLLWLGYIPHQCLTLNVRTYTLLLCFLHLSLACFVCPLALFFAKKKDFQNALVFILKKEKSVYVDLLEAVSLFTSLLVEVRSSTLGSPHTPQKRSLFGSCCCCYCCCISYSSTN